MPQAYLNRYAEAEAAAAGHLLAGGRWRHVLCIPTLDETVDFIARLATRPEDVLIILVVNQSGSPASPANSALLKAIGEQYPALKQQGHLSLHCLGAPSLLLVDRAHTPLPAKTGVGLARKIAADIALQLIHQQRVDDTWIYCTDADATLPQQYFYLREDHPAVAASLPFQHTGAPGPLLEATHLYEHAIRYYAQGLSFAGSGYGFLCLGSALAFKARAYAQVRGFNLREAGEDFYLLNKLAKLGEIYRPAASADNTITLEARLSNRTPFGTGACVSQMCQLADLTDFRYYAPECFFTLKHWFDLAPTLSQHSLTAVLKSLPAPLQNALQAQGIGSLADHLGRQGKNPQQIRLICHTWLDGFRSLKIIRHLQSQAFPATPLIATLAQQPFGPADMSN